LLQGYEPSLEPYLLMILKAHQDNRLTDIRTRCKIHVPKGRVLIGCLDETGELKHGQVFIRITKSSKEQKENDQPYFCKDNGDDGKAVLVGKVTISKNPCLHPGDIRVLEAVYDQGLYDKNLVDCVVFPQRGERYAICDTETDTKSAKFLEFILLCQRLQRSLNSFEVFVSICFHVRLISSRVTYFTCLLTFAYAFILLIIDVN
jgi:hypothetical protein